MVTCSILTQDWHDMPIPQHPHLSQRLCKLLVGLLQLSSQSVLPMLCSAQPLLAGSQLCLYASALLRGSRNSAEVTASIRVSQGAEGDNLM